MQILFILTNYDCVYVYTSQRDGHKETIATDFIHNFHFVTDTILATEVVKVEKHEDV
jgi:hypothetical protein